MWLLVLMWFETQKKKGEQFNGDTKVHQRTEVLVPELLGTLGITSYQSKRNQTDASPWITSLNSRTSKMGCAVSRDLLVDRRVRYGDMLFIEGFGLRIINDTMHKRHRNHVDLWVKTDEEESQVGWKRRQVWRISDPSKIYGAATEAWIERELKRRSLEREKWEVRKSESIGIK